MINRFRYRLVDSSENQWILGLKIIESSLHLVWWTTIQYNTGPGPYHGPKLLYSKTGSLPSILDGGNWCDLGNIWSFTSLKHTWFLGWFSIWAMVNTHYMVDGHPIHNKDPYNGYYKSLWTIGWLAPFLMVINHEYWPQLIYKPSWDRCEVAIPRHRTGLILVASDHHRWSHRMNVSKNWWVYKPFIVIYSGFTHWKWWFSMGF